MCSKILAEKLLTYNWQIDIDTNDTVKKIWLLMVLKSIIQNRYYILGENFNLIYNLPIIVAKNQNLSYYYYKLFKYI